MGPALASTKRCSTTGQFTLLKNAFMRAPRRLLGSPFARRRARGRVTLACGSSRDWATNAPTATRGPLMRFPRRMQLEGMMTFRRRRSEEKETHDGRAARTTKWTAGRWLTTVVFTVMLLGVVAMPASAHVRVFLGFGLPVYPYPYAYSYAPPPGPPCYAPYPYVAYGAPVPPGWVRGHWGWRADPWGRRIRVWAPRHLR